MKIKLKIFNHSKVDIFGQHLHSCFLHSNKRRNKNMQIYSVYKSKQPQNYQYNKQVK